MEVASKSFTDCTELSCSQKLPVHSERRANVCCTNVHIHIEPQPEEEIKVLWLKEFTTRTGTGWIKGFGVQMEVTRHRYQHAAGCKDLFTYTSTWTTVLRMDMLARIHNTYKPRGYTNLLHYSSFHLLSHTANYFPHQGQHTRHKKASRNRESITSLDNFQQSITKKPTHTQAFHFSPCGLSLQPSICIMHVFYYVKISLWENNWQ